MYVFEVLREKSSITILSPRWGWREAAASSFMAYQVLEVSLSSVIRGCKKFYSRPGYDQKADIGSLFL